MGLNVPPSIARCSDVVLTNPVAGDVLVRDANNRWVNQPAPSGSVDWGMVCRAGSSQQNFADGVPTTVLFAAQIVSAGTITAPVAAGVFTPQAGVWFMDLRVQSDLAAGMVLTAGDRFVQLNVLINGADLSPISPIRSTAKPNAAAAPTFTAELHWTGARQFNGTDTVAFVVTSALGVTWQARGAVTFTGFS